MDLNGDGHMDILSGSYSAEGLPEMAGLFQVLWGQEGGKFKKAEPLAGTDDQVLIIQPAGDTKKDKDIARICTRPTAVDFDADGDLDLFVGNFEGTYYLFRGEGKGKFSPKSELVKRDGKPLSTGNHSDPFFSDLDQDGDLDLICGSSGGGVKMVENIAGKGKVITFGKTTVLVKSVKGREAQWSDEVPKMSDSTRVFAEDLNSDGKPDLIIGDRVTVNSLLEGKTKEEALKEVAVLDAKIEAIYDKMVTIDEGSKDAQEQIAEIQKIWGQRDKILKKNETGFVWVMYQK